MADSCYGAFPEKEDITKRTKMQEWGCRKPDEYKKIFPVGKGTFGVVYKATNKKDNSSVALKKILCSNEKEGFPITAIREITIMKRLKHENILKLIEVVASLPDEKNDNKGIVYLVFEYMEHDFAGLLKASTRYNLSQIKCILHQILSGIGYLHSCNIIHRDIKTANILLNKKGEIKVGDFGLARVINPYIDNKKYTNPVVTLWYRAPELLLGERNYGPEIDVWSVGCVFGELLTGIPIFNASKDSLQVEKIFENCGTPNEETWPGVTSLKNWKPYCPKTKYQPKLRHIFDEKIVDEVTFDLLNKMLTLNPKKRITIKEALEHPFFGENHLPKMCRKDELPEIDVDSHELEVNKNMRNRQMRDMNNNGHGNQIRMQIANGEYNNGSQSNSMKANNSVDFIGKKRKPE